jgi:hypothetical protein
METPTPSKSILAPALIALAVLALTASPSSLMAQAVAPTTNAPAAAAKAPTPEKPKPTTSAEGIADVLKMAEAGVSKDVIRIFVEKSGIPYRPTPLEIITMKKRNVPDEVITAILNSGDLVQKQLAAAAAEARASAGDPAEKLSVYGPMNPESEEFWWYHYGYPRSLAGSSRMLDAGPPRFSYNVFDRNPAYYWSYPGLMGSSSLDVRSTMRNSRLRMGLSQNFLSNGQGVPRRRVP